MHIICSRALYETNCSHYSCNLTQGHFLWIAFDYSIQNPMDKMIV